MTQQLLKYFTHIKVSTLNGDIHLFNLKTQKINLINTEYNINHIEKFKSGNFILFSQNFETYTPQGSIIKIKQIPENQKSIYGQTLSLQNNTISYQQDRKLYFVDDHINTLFTLDLEADSFW